MTLLSWSSTSSWERQWNPYIRFYWSPTQYHSSTQISWVKWISCWVWDIVAGWLDTYLACFNSTILVTTWLVLTPVGGSIAKIFINWREVNTSYLYTPKMFNWKWTHIAVTFSSPLAAFYPELWASYSWNISYSSLMYWKDTPTIQDIQQVYYWTYIS